MTERMAEEVEAISPIVIGVDFGESSGSGAQWVADQFPGAELVLVHAVYVPEPAAFIVRAMSSAPTDVRENARRGADVRLREIAGQLTARQIRVDPRLGEPASAIVAAAEANEAALVVVGEHGQHSGLRRLLGSTAERVVHAAHAPVLVARSLPTASPRRLLVAIDDSPLADTIIAWTAQLARRWAASVVLSYIIPPVSSGATENRTRIPKNQLEPDALQTAAEHWLDGHAAGLRSAGIDVTIAARFGSPAAELLALASEVAADLLVVGRRRPERMAPTLIGTVTNRLVRQGTMSVLVIPEP